MLVLLGGFGVVIKVLWILLGLWAGFSLFWVVVIWLVSVRVVCAVACFVCSDLLFDLVLVRLLWFVWVGVVDLLYSCDLVVCHVLGFVGCLLFWFWFVFGLILVFGLFALLIVWGFTFWLFCLGLYWLLFVVCWYLFVYCDDCVSILLFIWFVSVYWLVVLCFVLCFCGAACRFVWVWLLL